MPKASNIIPVTDFRQNAAAIIGRVARSKEPLVITRRGRATAVLVSVEQYDRTEYERELLYLLAHGEAEISAGKGYNLDSILAEADKFLARGCRRGTVGRKLTRFAGSIPPDDLKVMSAEIESGCEQVSTDE